MTDDRFAIELAFERLEGELAGELPAHVRGFASAYAAGKPSPAAAGAATRPAALELALRAIRTSRVTSAFDAATATATASATATTASAAARASTATASAGLRDEDAELAISTRALSLLRLLAPIAIENDAAVAATRSANDPAATTWDAWRALAAAREAASKRRFGIDHVALMHWLHGSTVPDAGESSWPAPLDGWHTREAPLPHAFVERAWRDLADRHGARGTCRIVRAPDARPRAFVVEPGKEVIVVIGELATPAQRFAALHELGHAIAALLVEGTLPRVVDEAAAAYVARLAEVEGALDLAWFTPLAEPARVRRRQIAAVLDAIERGAGDGPIERPPWGLWNDPGAQAAYVDAEPLADRWWTELGAMTAPGAFTAALVDERRRIDRRQLAAVPIG